ncbi:MAG TPA: prolyl oligopeptidase family serine peptidase [Cyclobacteriaceae bacterium]|nr:prolyl oligopeptidase family serine peptidase [Cyclobacteriaceae bacterium]
MSPKQPFILLVLLVTTSFAIAQTFSIESVKSYPFPTELVASSSGARIAWAADERGKRNVYVAEGPDFKPRMITNYANDDGQEITSLAISPDGKFVVFVRGGDHGSNWDDGMPVNPSFTAEQFKVQIISVPFAGGEAKTLSEGDEPAISPKSDVVIFIKGGQPSTVPIDGSAAAKSLFVTRGTVGNLEWSDDGSQLAFVASRGDHSLIGIYKNANTPIQWIAPSFTRDYSPKWSPDGTKLAFIRTPGSGGAPDSLLTRRHNPWAIWTAEVSSGKASQIYKSPATLRGSVPTTHGSTNLHWAAGDKITFLSYQDGWPHLYSIDAKGGKELLLTPGNFMAEHVRLSPDKKWLMFSGNTGPDANDLDRRHAVRVAVDKAGVEVMTPGTGLEWTPVITGDGSTMALISATAQRPPVPAVIALNNAKKEIKLVGAEMIPSDFPTTKLVTPKKVTFRASDGVTVHADVFEPANGSAKKPAIVYVHGGPPRQMLLGWHYSDYYANAYATNQYLANLGFIVLSVNYRLGIGYGFDFHQPANAGMSGASEYLDIKAAGEWLAKQTNVDAARIGVYGGSYGGFLTALALGRDSKLFAAGVDIHGVHDFVTGRAVLSPPADRYEKAPDLAKAIEVAWQSSPVAYVSTWKSPVLIIHGDDDRNVRFNQSTDLVRRLEKKGDVSMETMVIVDDTHHWMKHSNAIKVDGAIGDYFVRKFLKLQ